MTTKQLLTVNLEFVDGPTLLKTLFPVERRRPCYQWLRDRTADRTFPYFRVGRLFFYEPEQCAEALRRRNGVKAKLPMKKGPQFYHVAGPVVSIRWFGTVEPDGPDHVWLCTTGGGKVFRVPAASVSAANEQEVAARERPKRNERNDRNETRRP